MLLISIAKCTIGKIIIYHYLQKFYYYQSFCLDDWLLHYIGNAFSLLKFSRPKGSRPLDLVNIYYFRVHLVINRKSRLKYLLDNSYHYYWLIYNIIYYFSEPDEEYISMPLYIRFDFASCAIYTNFSPQVRYYLLSFSILRLIIIFFRLQGWIYSVHREISRLYLFSTGCRWYYSE